MFSRLLLALILAACFPVAPRAVAAPSGFLPGNRVLLDAHNCYPYQGQWADRIDRALATGFPLAIEIDLYWFDGVGSGGPGRAVVAHDRPKRGDEPGFAEYFFEKARPSVEQALQDPKRDHWPIITLNINDLRGGRRELVEAVWEITGRYESWLCTAPKGNLPEEVQPMTVNPILILSNSSDTAREIFYDRVPIGGNLRIFGVGDPKRPATNYGRWVNYSWSAVEPEGQPNAGEWTPEEAQRLKYLVDEARGNGYWIRFYSLNGHGLLDLVRYGRNPNYNFGSIEAARIRWQAAFEAGVDFIASDQYEEIVAFLSSLRGRAVE